MADSRAWTDRARRSHDVVMLSGEAPDPERIPGRRRRYAMTTLSRPSARRSARQSVRAGSRIRARGRHPFPIVDARLLASALARVALALGAASIAEADVYRDGTVGMAGAGAVDSQLVDGIVTYRIDENDGHPIDGRNLFLSFERFDLSSNEIAEFGASGPIRNFISRITGGRSTIDGRITSTVEGASLFFLNPDGMLFGENASLDVSGSFVLSSADRLDLSDGGVFRASPLATSALSAGDPAAWGFLGGPIGDFEIRGRLQTCDDSALACSGGNIEIYGGAINVIGGALSALDADVSLVSLASEGTVHVDPTGVDRPRLAGFDRRGDVRVVDDAIVSSSGLSPLIGRVSEPGNDESFLVRVGLATNLPPDAPFPPPGRAIPAGSVPFAFFFSPANGYQYFFAYPDTAAPAFSRGAGRVFVAARNLTVEDSDLRAITVGGPSDGIELALTGDLTIRRIESRSDVGLLARTGDRFERAIRISGPPTCGDALAGIACEDGPSGTDRGIPFSLHDFSVPLDFDQGAGPGGDIDVTARNVFLRDGGRITTTSVSRGSPGEIRVAASGDIEVTGVGPPLPDDAFAGSAIFSNHQGRPLPDGTGRDGGDIDLDALSLLLTGGGGVFAQTTGDGNAGSIEIDVSRLEILDDSQIDSSTSGESLEGTPPGPQTTGAGGRITVRTLESVRLAGNRGPDAFARISTLSGERSGGGAGTISVETPLLQIEDGAGIAVTTRRAGTGGNIEIRAGRVRMEDGARLAAESTSEIDPAGDVSIETQGGFDLLTRSRIDASTGLATGGQIRIDSKDVVALGAQSVIRADAAREGGSGGRVVIDAPLVVRAATASVSASAPGGPEFQGEVVINSPVVTLGEPLQPPDASLLDASSLLLSPCAARRTGERAGSFQVARWSDIATSLDGPLLAHGPLSLGDRDPIPAQADPSAAAREEAGNGQEARLALARGEDALRGGRFEEADERFEEAAERAVRGAPTARVDALRGLGHARRLRGDFVDSLEPLEEALGLAREVGDARREAAASSELGSAWLAMGRPDRARVHLEDGVSTARRSKDPRSVARALVHLGNLASIESRTRAAQEHYREAASEAEDAGDRLLAAQALANAARVELKTGAAARVVELLGRVESKLEGLSVEHEAIALRLHLADTWSALASTSSTARNLALPKAHRLLVDASAQALAIGDERLRSQIFGRLGGLYEDEGGRTAEALYLTRRAIRSADRAQAPALLARWYHQAGRIASRAGELERAIDLHRRAVGFVEELHPETRARYGGDVPDFRSTVQPYYLALVETLLDASGAAEGEDEQSRLSEARDALERWKAAELRDYFQDECVARLESQARPVDRVAGDAAIVYPILLSDRIEILVSTRAGLARSRVDVPREVVVETAREFRNLLGTRTSYAFLRPARILHGWLVEPYVDALAAEGVDTLVFVLGESLRTIPMSALHDGRRFLVETHAVAVTPSLRLIAPRALEPGRERLLLAGLSESVQGFPPLENVRTEVDSIRALYGGEVLLDAGFRQADLEEAIRERRPGIVHIASHASFTGRAETSYVLAFDRKLSMEHLAGLIRSNRFGEEPLELLVLSACETAAGDDRSALGLAGLAIRAGARSALGSLWPVNDEATSELIVSFYRSLRTPKGSKAEALARGQRNLIADPRFDHPYYWAGFLVIANWL